VSTKTTQPGNEEYSPSCHEIAAGTFSPRDDLFELWPERYPLQHTEASPFLWPAPRPGKWPYTSGKAEQLAPRVHITTPSRSETSIMTSHMCSTIPRHRCSRRTACVASSAALMGEPKLNAKSGEAATAYLLARYSEATPLNVKNSERPENRPFLLLCGQVRDSDALARIRFLLKALTGTSLMPPNSKRKLNAPEVLKVWPRNCFVISTTRNATANPRYGFGPSSEVT
jgi:hypothetical protein